MFLNIFQTKHKLQWLHLIFLVFERGDSQVESHRRGQSALSYSEFCGMQTPGTLIVDGGKYERLFEESTSQSIWQNIPNSDPDNAKIVLIPGAESEMKTEEREKYTELWTESMGFRRENFHILHPESDDSDDTDVGDAAEADRPEFVEPLFEADAVFVRGGRQWRLIDAFKYTLTHEALWDVLDRGGVIAGTSAGATSQGFLMPRGDPGGSAQLMADREWHQYGFGYLPNVAFDVHVDARDRWDDLYDVIREDTSLLGIGIAEKTAIVVQGHYFQVVGYEGERDDPDALEEDDDLRSSVAVYDCSDRESCNWDDTPYLELIPGEWYDLCSRRRVSGPESSPLRFSRMYELPYDFTTDYRLAAPSFLCSGRRCGWLSSTIELWTSDDTEEEIEASMLRLTATVQSEGEMEIDGGDYLQISYRVSNDPRFSESGNFFGGNARTTDWMEAHDRIQGNVENNNLFLTSELSIAFPNRFRYFQLRIEAATSREARESYRIEALEIERIPYSFSNIEPSSSGATTRAPTRAPTRNPTRNPTRAPTRGPTRIPTSGPTTASSSSNNAPTSAQTRGPTRLPTRGSTRLPTSGPTRLPTRFPNINRTRAPTSNPTNNPTSNPTRAPTRAPTWVPTRASTRSPTRAPTQSPTVFPTNNPTEPFPTTLPPNIPSSKPTRSLFEFIGLIPNPTPPPTTYPTTAPPSTAPTKEPSIPPTQPPSFQPTRQPTPSPTVLPTEIQTAFISQSSQPTQKPILFTTIQETFLPTFVKPTEQPTTIKPRSAEPTSELGQTANIAPSLIPSIAPTIVPTVERSIIPSIDPTVTPTVQRNSEPISQPVQLASTVPSFLPSTAPTKESQRTSYQPTKMPLTSPTDRLVVPSQVPTGITLPRPTVFFPSNALFTNTPSISIIVPTPINNPSMTMSILKPTLPPSIHVASIDWSNSIGIDKNAVVSRAIMPFSVEAVFEDDIDVLSTKMEELTTEIGVVMNAFFRSKIIPQDYDAKDEQIPHLEFNLLASPIVNNGESTISIVETEQGRQLTNHVDSRYRYRVHGISYLYYREKKPSLVEQANFFQWLEDSIQEVKQNYDSTNNTQGLTTFARNHALSNILKDVMQLAIIVPPIEEESEDTSIPQESNENGSNDLTLLIVLIVIIACLFLVPTIFILVVCNKGRCLRRQNSCTEKQNPRGERTSLGNFTAPPSVAISVESDIDSKQSALERGYEQAANDNAPGRLVTISGKERQNKDGNVHETNDSSIVIENGEKGDQEKDNSVIEKENKRSNVMNGEIQSNINDDSDVVKAVDIPEALNTSDGSEEGESNEPEDNVRIDASRCQKNNDSSEKIKDEMDKGEASDMHISNEKTTSSIVPDNVLLDTDHAINLQQEIGDSLPQDTDFNDGIQQVNSDITDQADGDRTDDASNKREE